MYGSRQNYPWNTAAEYARYLLAYHCMPTLRKVKPASLIHANLGQFTGQGLPYSVDRLQLLNEISAVIRGFDCNYIILSEHGAGINLLVYQEEILCEALTTPGNMQLLTSFGYRSAEKPVENALLTLCGRFEKYHISRDNAVFPHEVGAILGYPVEDVEAFIKNQGKNYILCGYWKVYYNRNKAAETFECYHRLRQEALSLIYGEKSQSETKNIPKI